jgi:glycine hydroxymethyltransferase
MCSAEHAAGIDKAVFPGLQGGPLEHIIAAKAVALKEALSPDFKVYAQNVVKNAKTLAKTLMEEGIDVVGGVTENHLMTMDLRKLNKTGKDVSNLLEEVGITANKNTVPNDPQSPFVTSGVRLGTPAATTRGFGEAEFVEVGKIIADAVLERQSIETLRARSLKLCEKFPLYPEMG